MYHRKSSSLFVCSYLRLTSEHFWFLFYIQKYSDNSSHFRKRFNETQHPSNCSVQPLHIRHFCFEIFSAPQTILRSFSSLEITFSQKNEFLVNYWSDWEIANYYAIFCTAFWVRFIERFFFYINRRQSPQISCSSCFEFWESIQYYFVDKNPNPHYRKMEKKNNWERQKPEELIVRLSKRPQWNKLKWSNLFR